MLPAAILLCFLTVIIRGRCDPTLPTDNFISPCLFLSDPPTDGFKLWSQSDTWGGGSIPGVGDSIDSNVTIPCGLAILLDVPFIQLHTLHIQGFLKFLDSPDKLSTIQVKAHYILVEGQLTIGTPSQQFRSKATIELTPNVLGNRADLLFTSNSPADANHPRNLGHKAFAVVGGQVHFHGLTVDPDMPMWARLARTANVGDSSLLLDQSVSWPVGSEIVVATTDYDANQTETFVINSNSGSQIGLNNPFKFMHYGNPSGLSDGFGGFVNQCAEVALLTRNIIIYGTNEPPPYNLEGGHFIIFHTQIQQFVEGVDFQFMGQQGRLGRYPIHFHLNGDQSSPSGTVCRKNTIRYSRQRCIVIHATFGLNVVENVAFNTFGHCFMTEEGGETNNRFIRNIGITVFPVSKLIPLENAPNALPETDNSPSVFWLSNPNNHLIGNVGIGASDAGIWFELRRTVRGISRFWSLVNRTVPIQSVLGTLIDNTVHSNRVGLRFYPHGLVSTVNGRKVNSYISNLNSYKNSFMGSFSHRSDGLVFQNATFADNQIALWMNVVQRNLLNASRVIGFSNNMGTPRFCQTYTYRYLCLPTVSCSLPLPSSELGRSVAWNWRNFPLIGIRIQEHAGGETGYYPNAITSTTFSGFNTSCYLAASISLAGSFELRYWSTAHYTQNLGFSSDSNRLWFPPPFSTSPPSYIGEEANFFAVRDVDGSLVGAPGYAVANYPFILPTDPSQCTFRPSWNAYACPNTCYRSILVEYPEHNSINVINGKLGDLSSLIVTRVEDGKSFRVYGNYKGSAILPDDKPTYRFFYFSVLAGMTYSLTVNSSVNDPLFFPQNFTIRYKDGYGCGQPVIFRVPPPPDRGWNHRIPSSKNIFFRSCTDSLSVQGSNYRFVCDNGLAVIEIYDLPRSTNSVTIYPSYTTVTCSNITECGIMNMAAPGWRYDTSGLELRPSVFTRNYDDSWWPIGTAPFGNRVNLVTTIIPNPNKSLLTYYYRKAFVLNNASCYTGMNVDVTFQDGIVLYLNQIELYRSNMPSSAITNTTKALSMNVGDFRYMYKRLSFDNSPNSSLFLMEGINVFIAEVHSNGPNSRFTSFDLRVSALRTTEKCDSFIVPVEVCDGIDNNYDGLIDKDASGNPLTRPCSTPCGTGIEYCLVGVWMNCSAKQSTIEKCNNLDDDCDGLVDNGLDQLDCPADNACFAGICQPVIGMIKPLSIWGSASANWSYLDQEVDLDALVPLWRNQSSMEIWRVGTAPLGNNIPGLNFGTLLNPTRRTVTTFFRKTFLLSAEEIMDTVSVGVSVLRDDGVVVYLNGVEIFRDNMPSGPVSWRTLASRSTVRNSPTNSKFVYYNCTRCLQNTTRLLRDGQNVIAAELHQFSVGNRDLAFDLQLFRNAYTSCSDFLGSPNQPCVRSPSNPITLLDFRSEWRYSDSSLAEPPTDWTRSSFSDLSWLQGTAPLGNSNPKITTFTNSLSGAYPLRPTIYFRKSFFVEDPSCYFELNHTLNVKFGAAVYINGVEVSRVNLPSGSLNSSTLAASRSWGVRSIVLSGNWLLQGQNVLAVEVHNFFSNSINAFFDSRLTARVRAECAPSI